MKYLSPKQLGRAIGVSESSLKRWIDGGQIAVVRTTGGHRRIELNEAVRFVRQRGYAVTDPAAMGLAAGDEQAGRPDHAQHADHLFDQLTRGKDRAFIAALTRLYLDGMALAELIDGPVREAMSRIGELWHRDPEGIGVEHRATDICIRALAYLHTIIKPARDDAPLALGGAPAGDLHLIASMCVSLVLAEQGWREINLGANTPWDQFVALAKREHASLVWLSLTDEAKPGDASRIAALSAQLAEVSCQLIVGGRQMGPSLKQMDQPNLHTAGSMTELVAFGRGLLAQRRG